MNIVITGASGNIGKSLFHSLKSHKVIPFYRRKDMASSITHGEFWDISRPAPENLKVDQPYIIHTAASVSNNINELTGSNISGIKNLMNWAVKSNSRHIIYFSSGAIYGYNKDIFMTEEMPANPATAYGHSKLIGEKILFDYFSKYNIPITIIRLYFPFGPGMRTGIFKKIEDAVRSGKPLTIKKDGKPAFTPVHLKDINNAINKIVDLNAGGFKTFNLCGNDPVNFLEIVHIYEEIMKTKAVLKFINRTDGDILGSNELVKKEISWEPENSIIEIKNLIGE